MDEAHQRTARPGPHNLGLLIALQHVKPHQCRREPRHAPGLARPLRQEQVDHLISGNADPPAIGPRVARIGVARMIGVEVISLRPQVTIHLNAHPNRVAVSRLRHVVIDQIIRLKDLQRKRHPRITERPPDHPHKHLARFGHAARQQPLDVVEAKQSAHITAALMHPPLPLLVDLAVDHLIQPSTAQHLHLTLMPDAVPDHVVLDRAYRLPGVVVVAHQLPRTVAQ